MTMTRRGASPEAIRRHYDVANEFYELWLDPTLCYSCALWEDNEPDSMFELAQLRKLDFHANQVQAKNAERVLDVGSAGVRSFVVWSKPTAFATRPA